MAATFPGGFDHSQRVAPTARCAHFREEVEIVFHNRHERRFGAVEHLLEGGKPICESSVEKFHRVMVVAQARGGDQSREWRIRRHTRQLLGIVIQKIRMRYENHDMPA